MVHLEISHAFVIAAVEVIGGRNAGLGCSLGKSVQHIPPQALLFHTPFTTGILVAQNFAVHGAGVLHQGRRCAACTMHGVGALVVIFVQLEVGQAVVPRPVGITHQLGPLVIVASLAAHVNHAVDAAAAPQCFPARVLECATIEPLIRLSAVKPVCARVTDAVQVAYRDVNPVVIVLAAGLDQKHAFGGVAAQPVGQKAAGSAGTNDDVVEGGVVHFPAQTGFLFS